MKRPPSGLKELDFKYLTFSSKIEMNTMSLINNFGSSNEETPLWAKRTRLQVFNVHF